MSAFWQDDAVNAWRAFDGGSSADSGVDQTPSVDSGVDPTAEPDTVSADDLHETGYHNVYSDASGGWYSIEDRGEDQYAIPVDREQVELEHNLVSMYLERQGASLDDATGDQILDAVSQADAWLTNAQQNHGLRLEEAVNAEEEAEAAALAHFVDTHADGNLELAEPYINLAHTAMQHGIGRDEAFARAGDALNTRNDEVNTALREQHYEGLGYEKGVKTALSNFMASQHGPRHRNAGHAEKPAPANAGRLGNADVAKNQIDNAIARWTAQQREKRAFQLKVRENVRAQ